MKYTRVKAVTCALTASVIIFGSAAHTNASGVSYDLPAAGVGLVLDEGSSLASVQEEAVQNERTAETVQEAEEAPAVTSEDIESGMTGVGESAIDTEVVSHVQEQQVEAAIANGVGVASVLNTGVTETVPEAAVPAAESEVPLTAGVEAAVSAIPSETALIVAPVNLASLQNETESTSSEQPKEQTTSGSDPDPSSQKTSETASEQDITEQQTESRQESASEAENGTSSETETETSIEESSSESTAETSGTESASQQPSEGQTETTAEQPSESQTETATQQPSESQTETASQQPSESQTETASQQPSETQTETATEQPSESQTAAGTETVAESTTAPASTESSAEQASSESTAETAADAESVQAASAAASHTTTSSTGSSVAEFALQFVGNPYEYGGTSLTNGADCSGFVMSVYENFGVSLPHSSSADRSVGTEVEGGLSNAQPGDIVCYSGHVGIYIGNGQIVHASTEETGIKVSDADYRTPITVRRIFN